MPNKNYFVKLGKTRALLDELFPGDTFLERINKLGQSQYTERHFQHYDKERLVIGAWANDVPSSGTQISIGWEANPAICFYIRNYPACCGIMMLHHFRVSDGIPEELVHRILDTFFKENYYSGAAEYGETGTSGSYLLGRSQRLEVVMVESRRLTSELKVATAEIPEVENPTIRYKSLWTFFHKYASVRSRLQYNENSGNILHNMEVVFPKP
jgi:hypothetical protein